MRKTSTQAPSKNSSPRRTSRRTAVNENAVRERAYQLFAARGFSHGHDLDDWVAAEKELAQK